MPSVNDNGIPAIDEATYQWCVRAFSLLRKHLGVNIKVHDADGHIEAGQIFLFNHFTRFETIIPQYIIYQETGAFCRSIAAGEFFAGSAAVANFLGEMGVVPNDLPGLLPFLAAEILRGRKVIFFPEGGMVKDRSVIDAEGKFSIFSSTAGKRRKHHKGAAALSLTLELFKKRILAVHAARETARLERWVAALGLDDVDALLAAARRQTAIVPANITFYPIRTEDNILRKGAEIFSKGLAKNFQEELLIEGNILLKHTDMDIRFGRPVAPDPAWNWWNRVLLERLFAQIKSLEDLFALRPDSSRWINRMVSTVLARRIRRLRDQCMREMYARVTVNLSHLASRLIMTLVANGLTEVRRDIFHRALYLAIKGVQTAPAAHLHRGLTNPEAYEGVHAGHCRGFDQFLSQAVSLELLTKTADRYRFLPKLWAGAGFHEVRLENTVQVYANEVASVAEVCRVVDKAVREAETINPTVIARHLFEDEIRAYECCKVFYSKPQHAEINAQQTATEDARPYLLTPERRGKLGVVLVHGFLASPAELKALGERLAELGYPVMGVRLKGHGTSPWDLRDRTWEDWLVSVRRGFEIISCFADRVCLIGFSSGGSLALRLAAERPDALAGVVAVSTPLKFRNKNLIFVPLIHGANKLTEWVSSWEGMMPFRVNESEHPHINYRHIPIRGLFELRRLVDELSARLPDVKCPLVVIQGTEDRVVHPKSAELILNKAGSERKELRMIESERHGILNEDVGGIQKAIVSYLAELSSEEPVAGAGQPQPLEPDRRATGGRHNVAPSY